jgi:hypothetical protein
VAAGWTVVVLACVVIEHTFGKRSRGLTLVCECQPGFRDRRSRGARLMNAILEAGGCLSQHSRNSN